MEMSQKEFKELSEFCSDKEDWKCSKTTFVCKDYMCPKLKGISNINEARLILAK